jgi:hypothetical protein
MDNQDVCFFDAVMNAIWISCDEPTPQLRNLCVPDSEMRSRADEFDRIEECLTHPVRAGGILFGCPEDRCGRVA